jgi:DNA-binding transcriptional regulator YiaG
MSKANLRGEAGREVMGVPKATKPPKTTRGTTKAPGRVPSVSEQIRDSVAEIRAAMESGEPIEDRLTVREVRMDFDPRPYGPADCLRVRNLMNMSQAVFAKFLGVVPQTVKSWEQGTRPPSDMAKRFLEEIEADPKHWKARVAAKHTHRQVGKGAKS